MKEFKKDKQGYFICEECGKTFIIRASFGSHIGGAHKTKEYFDKYLKEKNDDKCKICGKETSFKSLSGYKNVCHDSIKCKKEYNLLRTKEEVFKKYGVETVFQLEYVKEKSKQTCLKNYGVEHSLQNKEIKEKSKQTCLKNHGVEYPMQSNKIKEKSKQTCLKNYGVEFNMQNKKIFEKQQHSAFYLKYYKNTNITYRGAYELDFLEKNHDKYPDIQNGPTIRYELNNKIRIYYPDFYILSLNLIIEIKNSHLLEIDEKILKLKKDAVLYTGFNYIMIVNKNYLDFENLIKKENENRLNSKEQD